MASQRAVDGSRIAPFLAGFALGSATTFVTIRSALPVIADRFRAVRPTPSRVERPALIINRWSGDGKAERYRLADRAAAAGVSVTMLERGDDLRALARDAIDAGADAIGMAGGDGSLGLVAQVALERDVPFFCIPVGTRNHFALDIGLNRDDPLSALAAIDAGEEFSMDYGLAGDRVFLNNASFGLYAMAVHREEYRADKVGTLTAIAQQMGTTPDSVPSLQFALPDGRRADHAAVLLISNNRYVWSGPPDFGRRARLNKGELGAMAMLSVPRGQDVMTVALRDLTGREEWSTPELVLGSDDDSIAAGVDGEAVMLPAPVHLRTVPGGLRVLVPAGTRPGYVAPRQKAVANLLDIASLAEEDDE
jgi:diacylglycerol kinase family enzyme